MLYFLGSNFSINASGDKQMLETNIPNLNPT